MKNFFNILKKCPLFNNIEDENLSAILGCLGAKKAFYRKSETVFTEGDPAKYIGVVLSGRVQIERVDYYGNRSILGNVEPGQLFAEAFACGKTEILPVSVVASDDAEVLLLDCNRVIHSCSNGCEFHSRLILNLLKIVANKNIHLTQKAEIISKRTTREKLLAYLMLLAKETGSNSFTVPFNRQELADYLEVDRSGLSSEIGKLIKEGKLECCRSKFRLLR